MQVLSSTGVAGIEGRGRHKPTTGREGYGWGTGGRAGEGREGW